MAVRNQFSREKRQKELNKKKKKEEKLKRKAEKKDPTDTESDSEENQPLTAPCVELGRTTSGWVPQSWPPRVFRVSSLPKREMRRGR